MGGEKAANRRGENGVFDGGGFGGGRGGSSYRGGHSGPGGNWRHKKLDMPTFDGTNPDGWVLRGERFFAFYGLRWWLWRLMLCVGINGRINDGHFRLGRE